MLTPKKIKRTILGFNAIKLLTQPSNNEDSYRKHFEDDHISESDIKEFFQLIKGTNKESNILAKVKKKILSSQQER